MAALKNLCWPIISWTEDYKNWERGAIERDKQVINAGCSLLSYCSLLCQYCLLFVRKNDWCLQRSVYWHVCIWYGLKCMYLVRSDYWWSYIVWQTFTQADWIENFRSSRPTFSHLCHLLSPVIAKQNTNMRACMEIHSKSAG